MSSPDSSLSRRTVAVLGLSLLLGGLGGCFRPLYGTSGKTNVAAELAGIHVEPIGGFMGHELSNELQFLLTGDNEPTNVKYRLVVVPIKTVQGAVVDTLLGRSESSTNALTAQYKLYPVGVSTELTGGRVIESTSYDRTQQRYAGVRADRDADQRGAKDLADQIKTQLAIYFTTRP